MAVFLLVALVCVKCQCDRISGWTYIMRGSESWASVQLLSSQIVRIRKISSVHEGLEKANIQQEERGLKTEIVLSLKFLHVNILWPLSPPILTLDKLSQLRQRR